MPYWPPVSPSAPYSTITAANWPSRGTGADGDVLYISDTDACYVYSTTFSDYVRPWVAASASGVLDVTLTGAVVPASASPAWTEVSTVAITSDGTKISLDSTGGNANNSLCAYAFTQQTTLNRFMQGLVQVTSYSGTGNRVSVFKITDMGRRVCANLYTQTANNVQFISDTGAGTLVGNAIGPGYQNVQTEKLVELYTVISAGALLYGLLYVGCSAHPVAYCPTASFLASAPPNGEYRVGDAVTDCSALTTIRALIGGRY